MKLLAFTDPVNCGHCAGMKRAGTLKKFAAAHRSVQVDALDLSRGGEYEENAASYFKVRALPTFFVLGEGDAVLAKTEGAMNLRELEAFVAKAAAKAAKKLPPRR